METTAANGIGLWSFDLEIVVGLALTLLVYWRGFRELQSQLPDRFPTWRRTCFVAGLAVVGLALVSPIDAMADALQQFHMLQHWFLMMVAPPLLWLGAPAVPLMRGLPRRWLIDGLGPLLAWSKVHRLLDLIVRPAFSGGVWAMTIVVWHLPFAYQAALRSKDWHDFEHLSFLCAALLFWFPIIGPWPGRPASGGVRIVYLALAMVFNTIFSAVFAFSNRLFYPAYAEMPAIWGITPLADQNAAGAFLWIAGSLSMGIAVVTVLFAWLEPATPRPVEVARNAEGARPRRRRPGEPNLLEWPFLGATLRSLRVRRAAQITLFVIAAVIVADGFLGSRIESARNLAGVLPWTYWRGFVVIGLLVVGNVFCAVCPLTLSRSLAGRLFGHRFPWPSALTNSWLAVAGFVLFLWAYEAFSLWDSPYWTAWIVIGYFVTFFLIEGLFPRGTFCRSVCPIGQFHFVASAVSPFEVAALDLDVCSRCRSHDCLRGNPTNPGCPTDLFMPTKSGSMDCTFCLDCVRACPNDNIGLRTALPVHAAPARPVGSRRSMPKGSLRGAELANTAMVLLFGFGAFVNAAAMVTPVVSIERSLTSWLEATSRLPALSLGFGFALLVVPALATWLCARVGRALAKLDLSAGRLAARLATSLVPIGFAMWLTHFGFHLVTGIESAGPALARVARDLAAVVDANATLGASGGVVGGAGAAMSMVSSSISAEGLLAVEIAVLGIGLLASVVVAWRRGLEIASTPARAIGVAAPWMVICALLYAAGVWILLQPMEMRGMSM